MHFPRPRLWSPTFSAGSASSWSAGAGTRPRPRRAGVPAPLGYAVAVALGLAVAFVVVRVVPKAAHGLRDAFTQAPAHAGLPATPDTLLYTVSTGERATIWRQGASGKPVRATGDGGLQGAALRASDGSALLYLHADCGTCAALYMLRENGSGQTRVLGSAPLRPLDDGLRRDAAFSADGRFVAFAEAGADAPTPHIFLFDRRTGERRMLAPYNSAAEDGPVWSPDGGSVAFLSGGANTVVTTVNVETGELRPLNDQLDHATDLAWSPDGRYLSLLRGGQIWLIDMRDGHGFALATPGVVHAVGGWAPGARELIATVAAPEGASASTGTATIANVVAVPVDGGAPRTLARGLILGAPRWSADGRLVAWAEGSDTGWTLLTAPSSGGPPRPLASGAGQIALDDWR